LFVGHYSVSFAGKVAEKHLPLWLLIIAVQFMDVLWAVFVLLGIEKVRIVPGITASSPLDLYYMPYTHSLVGSLGWSVFAFAICQLFPGLRGKRNGFILGLAVFSHWILDLLVHRPDLPLYDSVFKMGFGLWNYRVPEFILEIGLLIGAAALYLRKRVRKGRIVGLVSVLLVIQVLGTFLLAPPSSDRVTAVTALSLYLWFAVLAWWADRNSERLSLVVQG
jgi:hypothetical protein